MCFFCTFARRSLRLLLVFDLWFPNFLFFLQKHRDALAFFSLLGASLARPTTMRSTVLLPKATTVQNNDGDLLSHVPEWVPRTFCSYGDMGRIAVEGQFPLYHSATPNAPARFEWTRVVDPQRGFANAESTARLVGHIDCHHESRPCVYVTVWLVDADNAPLVHYSSEARHFASCTIEWLSPSGVLSSATYDADWQLYGWTRIRALDPPDTNSLAVVDDVGMTRLCRG